MYVMTIAYISCLILTTSCCRLRRYEIMMVLNHGQYYAVSLCEENSSIQLDIILEQNMQKSAVKRKEIVFFFQTTLEKICKDLTPASGKPVPYIQCPHCDKIHLRLKNVLEGRAQLCNIDTIPQDYYQDLFEDLQGTKLTILVMFCYYCIYLCT